ncbi:MAG: arginine--pyruvate transaminase AruH [Wenzhouxiangellaceae bacterium]
MSVSRLQGITPIGVEQMGDLADSLSDPQVLRLENLDTDLRPPAAALAVSQQALADDDANSYLPFLGLRSVREAAVQRLGGQCGQQYDWRSECLISAGGLSGILNALLATLEPGDEVLLTDPVYAGLINRVRLAGGAPRWLPLQASADGWRLDLTALAAIDPRPVKVVLMMSPSMPTGLVLNPDEWQAIADFCQRADAWLINDAAMERILFDQHPLLHPAALPGMRGRVISVGSASKEYRMIGWRVGWVVGPAPIMADIARVSLANVVCQTGIAMDAVAAALRQPPTEIEHCVQRWQRRHDWLVNELSEFNPIPAHGGWSLLLDMQPLGLDAATASQRLLRHGKVAATPMTNWGSASSSRYLRLVFANEPLARLRDIKARFDTALS